MMGSSWLIIVVNNGLISQDSSMFQSPSRRAGLTPFLMTRLQKTQRQNSHTGMTSSQLGEIQLLGIMMIHDVPIASRWTPIHGL